MLARPALIHLRIQAALGRYDTLVVPCFSAFGLGGQVPDRLLPLLGPAFAASLVTEIDNRFGGEQTKGALRPMSPPRPRRGIPLSCLPLPCSLLTHLPA